MAVFDPAMFGMLARSMANGAPSGGLLEFLRNPSQLAPIAPSAGFGGDVLPANAQPAQGQMNLTPDRYVPVGDYQMPQFGNPMPQTPMQANAQMPQSMPQPAPQPGLGGNVMAGLNNLNSGGNPITMLANVIDGFATGQRHDKRGRFEQQSSQTAQALVSRGLDPALAHTVATNPELLRAVLPQLFGMSGQTDDIKEYQFAKREDPSLTFDKFMQRKKSVTGEFSLNPVYGTDAQGNTVLLQTGKSGEAIQTKLPEGVKVSSGVEKVDLGTSWGIIDKRSGQMIGTQPKDVAGAASQKALGTAQGEAQAELPAVQITADRTLKQIDDFEKSAGFNEVFGLVDQFRPNFTMSDAGRKSLTQFKQLEGRAFLEGRAMLKGGGAITDFESNKAEAAIARLGRSQSEADAKEALQEFKEAVRDGVAKLRAKAGGGARTAAPAAPAASGLPSGWSVKVN